MLKIKEGIKFDTLNEVYDYYNDNVIRIVNLKQLLFYCSHAVQPDWVDKSVYDNKLVAYYGKERTKEVWEKWLRNAESKMENN